MPPKKKHIYKKPPLAEAICEFRFESSEPWDWAKVDKLRSIFIDEFPKKSESFSDTVKLEPRNEEFSLNLTRTLDRYRFSSKDDAVMIQVGPNLLAVNHLQPYPGWKDVSKRIESVFNSYCETINPRSLQRIGLRFVNRLNIPLKEYEIESYVLAVPKVPLKIPQDFVQWVQRVDIPFKNRGGMMALQVASNREPGIKGSVILLDLDFFTLNPNIADLNNALDWVDNAHETIEDVFECCITEKTRELFEEVKQ